MPAGGSLYDAFYGTDVIPEDGGLEKRPDVQRQAWRRGRRAGCCFLDDAVPLTDGSHAEVSQYALVHFNDHMGLSATLADGRTTGSWTLPSLSAIASRKSRSAVSCCATTGCISTS